MFATSRKVCETCVRRELMRLKHESNEKVVKYWGWRQKNAAFYQALWEIERGEEIACLE